jgi:hypothetical protein
MRVPLLAVLLLLAVPVHAQTLDLKPRPQAAQPKLNLSRPTLSDADQRVLELRAMGVAQTSVERGPASFGFLCGLNPGQNLGGVHAARGYDPQGKFMGAKLAFAF